MPKPELENFDLGGGGGGMKRAPEPRAVTGVLGSFPQKCLKFRGSEMRLS